MGGIGKTTTGLRVAVDLRDDGEFLDGIAFVDLEGFSATREPLSTREALETLLRPLVGLETTLPNELPGLQDLWQKIITGKRLLVFLDNARDEDQVRPLLPANATCKTLATSRHRLSLDGLRPIQLGLMSPTEAKELALTLGNRWQQGRLSDEAATRLVKLCGYLPLSVKIAAISLGKAPILDIDRQLEKLASATRDALGIRQAKAVLQLSLNQLPTELRAAWLRLSAFEGDFDVEAAATVIEIVSADETLAELEQRNLVMLTAQNRLVLHDILRACALDMIESDELEMAGFLHARHYAGILCKAHGLYLAGGEHLMKGLKLYDTEQHQIHLGQKWAAARIEKSNRIAELAISYTSRCGSLNFIRLEPLTVLEWQKAQLTAAERLDDRRAVGEALLRMGQAQDAIGNSEEAVQLFNNAMDVANELNNVTLIAGVHQGLGLAYRQMGEHRRGIQHHQAQLEIFRKIDNQRGTCSALLNLGNAFVETDEAARSLDYHNEALELARKIGAKRQESQIVGNMAIAYRELGNTEQAIALFEERLSIAQDLRERLIPERPV